MIESSGVAGAAAACCAGKAAIVVAASKADTAALFQRTNFTFMTPLVS
jgi:hypothetical protein